MPGASGDVNNDQKTRTKLRNELYKSKSEHTRYKESIKEPGLLERWPKFLQLQFDLPTPTKSEALAQMAAMCPGKPASLEEIADIIEQTPYKTPGWKGTKESTDIEPRILSPEEVYVINKKYLELQTAFMAERKGQGASEAVADAEQNLATQAQNNHAQSNARFDRVEGKVDKALSLLQKSEMTAETTQAMVRANTSITRRCGGKKALEVDVMRYGFVKGNKDSKYYCLVDESRCLSIMYVPHVIRFSPPFRG